MGEMLENCYDEADEEFGRFVEHFGRGKSDRGIEDVILQAWQFSQSHPWPQECWVLAAVSIGGSMMGVVGMLIFIPLCSVVYALVREDVNRRLKRR